MDIVIVDDGSPAPAEPELEGLSRQNWTIRIIRQENGGPAKARNTALRSAMDCDYVAFIDSDDAWEDSHLSTALDCLGSGAQFYFADNSYEAGVTWFSLLRRRQQLLETARRREKDLYEITSREISPILLDECLPHTSTVVLDAKFLNGLRFDETQSLAGEDYLFWTSFVHQTERVIFNAACMVHRGTGIDAYRSKLSWDNPDCVRCLFQNLLMRKKFLKRFCAREEDKELQLSWINRIRREITYLFFRNAVRHASANWWVARQLASDDPMFWLRFMPNLVLALSERAKLRYFRGRHGSEAA